MRLPDETHLPEDLEVAVEVIVELEDGGDVAAAVAVVGCRPYRHKALGEHVLVSLLDELVGAADELESVECIELGGDLLAKEPAGASRGDGPASRWSHRSQGW